MNTIFNMKKALFCCLLISGFCGIYAQELDMSDYWEATDHVVIDDTIYEYELYSIHNKNLDAAIDLLVDNFWDYEGEYLDVTFSRNRSAFYNDNTDSLSPDEKRMLEEMKVNIATTRYFFIEGDRCFLYFTVIYTKNFRTYSTWVTWDEINPWRSF
jgi:hypothetical protein